ncbi:GNAT family N-acetyltransferase [Arthrobacter sp. GMC3]|uniref:GNAT family N-acetyltransferase n=1 Tax=Arthrobacter sp. GMC3 TaxID=2058894 RepID=UPI000CE2C136|nr:GNAT family N-acetyltransferase [Arthrobacter sp. GMC3]
MSAAPQTQTDAGDLASTYARESGVEIRELHDPAEMVAASKLLAEVWGIDPAKPQVNPGMMVALAHAGNYVAGAFDGQQMVGAGIGFFHTPNDNALHSHITGVVGGRVGGGIGKALKFHQRGWCLARGVDSMTWTFDPLVARNAFFNFERLGARAGVYLPNFYGDMDDDLNRSQDTDRLMLTWNLGGTGTGSPRELPEVPVAALRRGAHGPVLDLDLDPATMVCRVEIPTDIEKMRRESPSAAEQWRPALRNALTPLLADGWQIAGFDRSGFYRMERY